MVLFLYNLALLVALVAGCPWWLWQMATAAKYREGLRERLGAVPPSLAKSSDSRPVIWLHAVSVGEVLAVSRLVYELDRALASHRIVISTTTRTGQQLAQGRFGTERVFYCPLDLPWAVSRYLNALKPELLILAETEFWPNLLNGCFRRRIPVVVVNARVSDRSWPRYQALRTLWRPILSQLDRVLAQTAVDAERLEAIGCRADRVTVAGNLKFDVRAPALHGAAQLIQQQMENLRFVVAGSTLEGEEAALLEAWPRLLETDPNLALVIAPRHSERFNATAELLNRSGTSWIRRSNWPAHWAGAPRLIRAGEIILLDTIGELASVYSLAAVAFIGGSLVAAGGHNPLEPAQFEIPIVMGPHYENFRAMVDDLRAHDAIRIATKETLAGTLIELLIDGGRAAAMGARALQVFEAQAGATARCVDAISQLLGVEAAMERKA